MAAMRTTALRAGGACVRCRKGKTKCYYETGDPPCRNCSKGFHDCLLPGDITPVRVAPRPPREQLPVPERIPAPVPIMRHPPVISDKLTPELMQECERVISKTFPASVIFHKPSIMQQLKAHALDMSLVYGLLACAARTSPNLIRRYGGQSGATGAADGFAAKAMTLINQSVDTPSLADIQALCLIVIHEWGSRNAVRAYVYLGQAARILHMHRILGSHLATTAANADRFHLEESFRRTLWLIYVLDCLLTTTPGRSPALSDRDFSDVSLPCSDMNFAFGNAVWVKNLHMLDPRGMPTDAAVGDVGEFGHIVLAISIWRNVVGFLTSLSHPVFDDAAYGTLMTDLGSLRDALPMQFVDRPHQINLHITMGSGFTYAMLHSVLHCANIFLQRRRLLHFVTSSPDPCALDSWRLSRDGQDTIRQLFGSCQSVVSLLVALEAGADKDMILCFPIFMLFAAFTASATVAYLSLKGLTTLVSVETSAGVVRDGLHFMQDGVESWPLIQAWLRHLSVMQRVLNNDAGIQNVGSIVADPSARSARSALSIKDEVSSPESNTDMMDYDITSNHPSGTAHAPSAQSPIADSSTARRGHGHGHGHGHVRAVSEGIREDSEPPTGVPSLTLSRRPGVATVNGGDRSGGTSTPVTHSPPPAYAQLSSAANSPTGAYEAKSDSATDPNSRVALPGSSDGLRAGSKGNALPAAETSPPGGVQDMSPQELCSAFEKQLLELDDLAAFMGGGV